MKRAAAILGIFHALVLGGLAQTPDDHNEGSKLEWDSANSIWRFKWWGRQGRTYFIQHSDNLLDPWQWVPAIESGNDSVREWGFTTTGDKFFVRLKCSDIPTTDPSNADFDGDGVPNLFEVQNGFNPFGLVDTAANGMPDEWEMFNSGKFAIWPQALSTSIPRNQTANGTIYLRNDTGSPVNFSVALSGNTGPAYGFEDSLTGGATYGWEEISATGTLLSGISSADDASQEVALTGFSFPLFGSSSSSFFVSSNGFISFGAGSSSYSNVALPSPSAPRPVIAPFWDDLNPGSAGDVYFFQDANHAIVQFEAVSRYGGGGNYTFQVALYSDGRIQFRYKTMSGTLDSATVGVQNADGLLGLQMACNQPYLSDSLSIDISPQSVFLTASPTSGTVPAFTTLGVNATFHSLSLPFGTYNATITTSHDAPVVAGPHVTTATLEVINTPSVVAVTSPISGTVILQGNNVLLAATATDAEGVQTVEFYRGSEKVGEDSGQPYELTWYGPPVGTHMITARVLDSLGGVTISSPTTLIVLPDSDGDGMDDDWELQNGLDPALDDARLDLDGDGAFNRFEYVRATSPTDPTEVPPNAPASISITSPQSGAIFIQGQTVSISVSATDPDTGVSKVEFLKDGQKIGEDTYPSWSFGLSTTQSAGTISLTAVAVDEFGHQTVSPPVPLTIRADADLDGMPDDWETTSGLNPANPADAAGDLDNDGYTNLEEFLLGKDPNTAEDTDGDGLPDGKERKFIYRTLSGGWGYFNINSADTDGNGIADGQEDYDKDGLSVLQEVALGTNPNLSDTDGDGVSDGKEVSLGTNPLVADAWANRDSDNDGLDDFTEITIGSNPFNPDTNGNGMPDGEELDRGGDPANPGPPPPPLPPTSPNPEPPGDPSPEPPPAITPSEYDILVETKSVSFPKYGHATFQVLDPPKRYLTMTATQTYAGSDGEVESGPLGINGSGTWTIDALTGNTTTTGDNFVSSFGDAASPVRKSGTRQQYGYDDPPNEKGDGTATINGVTTLASENTTEMMVTNGKSKLEAFADDLQPGTPFAYRNVHENELAFDYQKVQFKFKWKEGVSEEQRYAVTYLLLFRPEDDPDTQQDESTENAEVIETITWNGQAGESQIFTLDPDQRKSGIDGSYGLLPVQIEARKQGTTAAPETGLLVKKGDVLEFALAPQFFETDDNSETLITWQQRQLNGDGTYTEWANISAQATGTKYEYTTAAGGIFQIKAVITNGGEHEYMRKTDAPHAVNGSGVYNEKLRKDKPDFIGVADNDAQISVRNQSLSLLGSTAYAKSAMIIVGYGVDPTLNFKDSWKCNIFVFCMSNAAGVSVPTKNWRDYRFGIPPYVDRAVPPGANDWYSSSFSIPSWTWAAASTIPQPGYAAIHQHINDTVAGGAHIGILDYDGTWISAGSATVNKSIHISDGDYQPTNYRKP